MTKSLAMIACAVGMTLLASARVDAGRELLASPMGLDVNSALQSTPKDQRISESGGQAESKHQRQDREELSIPRRST